MVEDGKLIQQRKAKCDKNWVPPKGFDEEFDAMLKQTKEISIASPDMFDITSKVGEELLLASATPPPEQTKEQKITDLKKQLKELQSGT